MIPTPQTPTIVRYANDVQVWLIRETENGVAGWAYDVRTDDGAELEDCGWAPTKREALDQARDSRASIATMRAWSAR